MGQYVTVHGDVISHLNISRSKVEDGGLFTCTAKNRCKFAKPQNQLIRMEQTQKYFFNTQRETAS